MYITFHLKWAQEVNSDILDAIKTTFKSKAITIIVEEDHGEFETTEEIKTILEDRLREDESTWKRIKPLRLNRHSSLDLTPETDPEQGKYLGRNCYKIRLSITSKGKGKRGGARVITNIVVSGITVYLLTIYDKADKENLTDIELKELLQFVPDWKSPAKWTRLCCVKNSTYYSCPQATVCLILLLHHPRLPHSVKISQYNRVQPSGKRRQIECDCIFFLQQQASVSIKNTQGVWAGNGNCF